ncbi:hypothetical protein CEXT_265001 [Caerostris extrusa]|uniref:Maturase K n=1 Tax=Caerostris extrusa TaxID=172846 RepID=A0AAV4NWY9_CAEEX|nr:hypothetical protein CEXT_265001 [Caerostris extrusa]
MEMEERLSESEEELSYIFPQRLFSESNFRNNPLFFYIFEEANRVLLNKHRVSIERLATKRGNPVLRLGTWEHYKETLEMFLNSKKVYCSRTGFSTPLHSSISFPVFDSNRFRTSI